MKRVAALAIVFVCLGSASVVLASPAPNFARRGVEQFLVRSSGSLLLAADDEATPTSPCEDPLFRRLQKKALDSLTTREYEYFQKKDKECTEYQKTLLSSEPVVRTPRRGGITDQYTSEQYTSEEVRKTSTATAVLVGIIGTCAFLLLISALASGS